MDSVDLIRAAPAGWWVAFDGKRPLHKWRDAPPDHGEVADHRRVLPDRSRDEPLRA